MTPDQERAALWGGLIADIYGADKSRAKAARKATAMLTFSEFSGGHMPQRPMPRQPSPYSAAPEDLAKAEQRWDRDVDAAEAANEGNLLTLMDAAVELERHEDTERAARELRFQLATQYGIREIPETQRERERLAGPIARVRAPSRERRAS